MPKQKELFRPMKRYYRVLGNNLQDCINSLLNQRLCVQTLADKHNSTGVILVEDQHRTDVRNILDVTGNTLVKHTFQASDDN